MEGLHHRYANYATRPGIRRALATQIVALCSIPPGATAYLTAGAPTGDVNCPQCLQRLVLMEHNQWLSKPI